MSRRHKRSKNKVRKVVAHGHDKASKTGHEISKDEDLFKSINIFAPHYKLPPYIERRFKEHYEKTMLVNRVHDAATNNRQQIAQSKTCGCYGCCATFPAAEVTDFVPGEDTALCPCCGTDSVLPDIAGFPLTPNFLRRMRRQWFGS